VVSGQCQTTLPQSSNVTVLLASSSRALGKIRCSTSFTRSLRLCSVSPWSTDTASCSSTAPQSTASCTNSNSNDQSNVAKGGTADESPVTKPLVFIHQVAAQDWRLGCNLKFAHFAWVCDLQISHSPAPPRADIDPQAWYKGQRKKCCDLTSNYQLAVRSYLYLYLSCGVTDRKSSHRALRQQHWPSVQPRQTSRSTEPLGSRAVKALIILMH